MYRDGPGFIPHMYSDVPKPKLQLSRWSFFPCIVFWPKRFELNLTKIRAFKFRFEDPLVQRIPHIMCLFPRSLSHGSVQKNFQFYAQKQIHVKMRDSLFSVSSTLKPLSVSVVFTVPPQPIKCRLKRQYWPRDKGTEFPAVFTHLKYDEWMTMR